ncbi:MAG TPA: hypothetical protein VNU46_09300 [Gemmatimonadaceae bacterium]|nr:hypothetical protein [Gemmatimonadaceae bacterium]
MTRTKTLPPKLPKVVFSVLGDVPVIMSDELAEKAEAIGLINFHNRKIAIQTNLSRETMWPTLFHEMTHLALNDSGTADVLTKKQEESVCNAMGLYLAAAVQAGYLKVILR